MILELLFIFTYCKEQPVSMQLNSLIAINRAPPKLPAGHNQWPLCPRVWQGGVQPSPELCPGSTRTCRMNGERASVWAPAQSCFSLPVPACTAAGISAGRGGGRRGQQSHLPQQSISLCQLMLFMELQLSPDNSAVCQRDTTPPGWHWGNMQQCQPTRSDTPAWNREQEGIFFLLCNCILPLPLQHLSGVAFSPCITVQGPHTRHHCAEVLSQPWGAGRAAWHSPQAFAYSPETVKLH